MLIGNSLLKDKATNGYTLKFRCFIEDSLEREWLKTNQKFNKDDILLANYLRYYDNCIKNGYKIDNNYY